MASKNRREREKDLLRAKILKGALKIIQAEGRDALTMRKLAEEIEYSPMALYTHFQDKNAILLALASKVFAELGRILGKRSRDPVVGLRKGMLAYIKFGLEHPHEYEAVFMNKFTSVARANINVQQGLYDADPEVPIALGGSQALRLFIQLVQDCVSAGKVDGDARLTALVLWTSMHGVVAIQIAQPQFPFGPRKELVEQAVEVLLRGILLNR